jgi:hypothetical protein
MCAVGRALTLQLEHNHTPADTCAPRVLENSNCVASVNWPHGTCCISTCYIAGCVGHSSVMFEPASLCSLCHQPVWYLCQLHGSPSLVSTGMYPNPACCNNMAQHSP